MRTFSNYFKAWYEKTDALCKILNFPPKCICVLGLLPLIFSTWGSHHPTEPPHKDTVLLCPGFPRSLRLCRGHQRLLAKAGNSKFYRVCQLIIFTKNWSKTFKNQSLRLLWLYWNQPSLIIIKTIINMTQCFLFGALFGF